MRNNALAAIEFLLEHLVDDSRLSKQHDGAVHIGVVHNQLNALKVRYRLQMCCGSLANCLGRFQLLIGKRPHLVDLPGERKKTPLHYAALIDNVDAAKILVSSHTSRRVSHNSVWA